GIISLGSMSSEGLTALPTQWGFAESAAKKHGTTVDRKNWRVLLSWHIAETRGKAIEEARRGLMHWHNRYNVATLQRAGAVAFKSEDEAIEKTTAAGPGGSAAVIGTPDDLVKVIRDVYAQSGGFGTVVGFVHDWANVENTFRSWDMVARYVVPQINCHLVGLRRSQQFVIENRAVFERSREAGMTKIMENDKAGDALAVTESPHFAASGGNIPNLNRPRRSRANRGS